MDGSRINATTIESAYQLHIWEEIVGELSAVQSGGTDELILVITEQPVLIRECESIDPNPYIGEMVSLLRTETGYSIQAIEIDTHD